MSDTPRPEILVAIDLAARSMDRLRAAYPAHKALTPDDRMACALAYGQHIRAIVTNGTTTISPELIAALPNLSIICAQGVGYEGIDLVAARARGIVVTNGPGTNADCVADHALALTLAVLRDIRNNDAVVRAGGWRQGDTMRPSAAGKRVGILGLGDIGARIARRCEAFGMVVAYHNRRPLPETNPPGTDRPDARWPYLPSPVELAAGSDILIVATPGGAETRHLVGQPELDALGPAGFLVNIGRGSVVDTQALVAALRDKRIAGAALDVIEHEPNVPQDLRDLPNVLLTPHMAGRSPESVAATIALVLENLAAHFAGKPPLTPVAV